LLGDSHPGLKPGVIQIKLLRGISSDAICSNNSRLSFLIFFQHFAKNLQDL
jgi:hypothetical protein